MLTVYCQIHTCRIRNGGGQGYRGVRSKSRSRVVSGAARSSTPAGFEKLAEEGATFRTQDAAVYFHAMVETAVTADVIDRTHGAGLFVARCIIQLGDAGV